jgi:hypothetical protein
MVEAWPSPTLVVAQSDFLLELLIITLDPPAHFCEIDQSVQ